MRVDASTSGTKLAVNVTGPLETPGNRSGACPMAACNSSEHSKVCPNRCQRPVFRTNGLCSTSTSATGNPSKPYGEANTIVLAVRSSKKRRPVPLQLTDDAGCLQTATHRCKSFVRRYFARRFVACKTRLPLPITIDHCWHVPHHFAYARAESAKHRDILRTHVLGVSFPIFSSDVFKLSLMSIRHYHHWYRRALSSYLLLSRPSNCSLSPRMESTSEVDHTHLIISE